MGFGRRFKRAARRDRGAGTAAVIQEMVEEARELEALTLEALGVERQRGLRGKDLFRFLGLFLLAAQEGEHLLKPETALSSEQAQRAREYTGVALMAIGEAAHGAEPELAADASLALGEAGVAPEELCRPRHLQETPPRAAAWEAGLASVRRVVLRLWEWPSAEARGEVPEGSRETARDRSPWSWPHARQFVGTQGDPPFVHYCEISR